MKIVGGTLHGEAAPTKLLAGILLAPGVHPLVGNDALINISLAAEMVVALAAGSLACGLSQPDADGIRRSLGGFFDSPVGPTLWRRACHVRQPLCRAGEHSCGNGDMACAISGRRPGLNSKGGRLAFGARRRMTPIA